MLRRDPAGLDAQVGEDGILLSGGERQRLAIARALLASPDVLLLDEPTASLDGRNEQALRQAIDAMSRDRTVILVAHRLATVVDADQILVLEDGRAAGGGHPPELLRDEPALPRARRAPAAGLSRRRGGPTGTLTDAQTRRPARPAIRPENRQPPRNDALERAVAVHPAAAESGDLPGRVQPRQRLAAGAAAPGRTGRSPARPGSCGSGCAAAPRSADRPAGSSISCGSTVRIRRSPKYRRAASTAMTCGSLPSPART